MPSTMESPAKPEPRDIAKQLGLSDKRVAAAMSLLSDGNTVPFIARYRKEATGGLNEVDLRGIEDAVEHADALASRKATILKSMGAQGVLTPALRTQIDTCHDFRRLEAIYLPFKSKRRSRATIAREQGLQPLADLLLSQQRLRHSRDETLATFINPPKNVPDAATALQGGLDIVAEQWSEQAETREWVLGQAMSYGKIASTAKRGKKEAAAEKFEQYLDHHEPIARVPSHRLLAMLRGDAEGLLRVRLLLDDERELKSLQRRLIPNPQFEFARELMATVEDCYRRLLLPATESSVLQLLKEKADEEAIAVFGKNLRELLMAPPAGQRVTMGIDPGFRTGCKVAVVDATGKFLEQATIYPTAPRNDALGATTTLLQLIDRHGVELVAIGNGTASRETDTFLQGLIRENQLKVTKAMVSESGASIYSASEIAAQEFPDLDLTVRGAISIARRLQDPLAELVKSDPKSIGVGQYQHDVNQPKLRKCLDRVVESCVNHVGVDLNTASAPLLSYVAGIGSKLAHNIVAYRDAHGKFANRQQLAAVPKLGKKAFEQAAGFLRIRDGDQPLDNSAVHPERYAIVNRMAHSIGANLPSLVGNASLTEKIQPEMFMHDEVGLPTITDILSELAKPGRDPRSEFRAVQFHEGINDIEDLRPAMILEGVITNVTHFGVFVDIGVHQDGLIHISQLADTYVSDPNDLVAVGDVLKVKVLDIDVPRKRISLTRKF